MAKQVVGLFDSMQDAQGAVQELRNGGFSANDISIVANNASGQYSTSDGGGSEAAEGAGAGATGGAILGGLGGLLVGLGALAIPGIGPVVAAGTLATALGTTAVGAGLGAAAGGLVGALVGAGIPEEDAGVYAEGVRRGGALVTVQAETDSDADRAADILDRYNVVDIDERSSNYRSGGWSGYDANAGEYDRSMGGGSMSTADSGRSEWSESSKVGTAGGTLAGAATGAAMGSVGGPVGTVIGGIAGAVTGGGVGAAGDAAGEAAADAATGEDDMSMGRSGGMSSGGMSGATGSGAAIGSATDYGTSGSGMTGSTGSTTTGYTDTSRTDMQSGSRDITADQGAVAIPVVEEEIRVGKREVESGGVRVETHVTETPVNEQVTLREEHVNIERRTVDQPVDAATMTDAFREGTFEVRERDEQAVVSKEARVVEEVVINKDVQQRTETIQDTVRRTDVDIQEIPGQTRTSGYTETSSTSSSGMSGTGMSGTDMSGSSSSMGGNDSLLDKAERGTGLDLDRDSDVGGRNQR